MRPENFPEAPDPVFTLQFRLTGHHDHRASVRDDLERVRVRLGTHHGDVTDVGEGIGVD